MDKVTEMTSKGYGFVCPWHGLETQVFCFRGEQPENAHLWRKIITTVEGYDANSPDLKPKEIHLFIDGKMVA